MHTLNIWSIYSQKVWLDGKIAPATIQIKADRIEGVTIGLKSPEAIDYSPAIIMPGVIDAHVHINEPGRTHWEGFETATKAAARGGTTMIVDMPLNSSPVTTDIHALNKKLEASNGKLHVNCGFYGGAVDADHMHDLAQLLDAGCLGIKVFLSHSGIDEFPNIPPNHLDKVIGLLSDYDAPILAHCELESSNSYSPMKNESSSYIAYEKSRPKSWENAAIELFANLCQKYNHPCHIVHLSSTDKLEFIHAIRKSGAPLTVETCPHYLLFNAQSIEDGDTLSKCAPPIRNIKIQAALKNAIKSGLIDFITTDHSPAPANLKQIDTGDIFKAWGGISGLQFLLSASWTALKEVITIEEFIPLVTSNPANFLRVSDEFGSIEEGKNASFTIWIPNALFKVKKDIIEHKHKETPYLGMTLSSQVIATIVNGKIAFQDDTISDSVHGKAILRPTNHSL